MQRTRTSAAAAAVALIFGLGACGDSGGSSSDAEVKDKIAEQFVDGGLDQDAADCFADVIVDEIGADRLDDVDFSDEEPPEGLQAEFSSAATKAIDECDLDLSSLDG
ncbi:MAG: hypothetical protein ACRDZU_11650 [Acidimicrobiales bacterium]